MTDQQRERDQLAQILDFWLAIVAVELAQQERLTAPRPPARVTPVILQKKLRRRRAELLKAS
jgi:hypothetical protein